MGAKTFDRRKMLFGGAAAASAAGIMSAGAAVQPRSDLSNPPSNGFKDAIKAGAVGDGHTDDQPALQHLFDQLAEGSVVSFPPGRYHLGKPLTLNVPSVTLLGHGAVFDHTIVLRAKQLRIAGLSVIGAPAEGFRIRHGQGCNFEALLAQENGGAGFIIGGNDGDQVAWSIFIGCSSLRNKGDGWLLDGTKKRNFINANTFNACWSRGNGGCGWRSVKRVHYNTWVATVVEGNCFSNQKLAPITLDGFDNFFYGGHVVDTQYCGNSISFRPDKGSMIFGGRLLGEVAGAAYCQAVVFTNDQRRAMRARKAKRRQQALQNDDGEDDGDDQ